MNKDQDPSTSSLSVPSTTPFLLPRASEFVATGGCEASGGPAELSRSSRSSSPPGAQVLGRARGREPGFSGVKFSGLGFRILSGSCAACSAASKRHKTSHHLMLDHIKMHIIPDHLRAVKSRALNKRLFWVYLCVCECGGEEGRMVRF